VLITSNASLEGTRLHHMSCVNYNSNAGYHITCPENIENIK